MNITTNLNAKENGYLHGVSEFFSKNDVITNVCAVALSILACCSIGGGIGIALGILSSIAAHCSISAIRKLKEEPAVLPPISLPPSFARKVTDHFMKEHLFDILCSFTIYGYYDVWKTCAIVDYSRCRFQPRTPLDGQLFQSPPERVYFDLKTMAFKVWTKIIGGIGVSLIAKEVFFKVFQSLNKEKTNPVAVQESFSKFLSKIQVKKEVLVPNTLIAIVSTVVLSILVANPIAIGACLAAGMISKIIASQFFVSSKIEESVSSRVVLKDKVIQYARSNFYSLATIMFVAIDYLNNNPNKMDCNAINKERLALANRYESYGRSLFVLYLIKEIIPCL